MVSPGWRPQSFGAKVSTSLVLPCRPSPFISEALTLPVSHLLHSGLGSLAEKSVRAFLLTADHRPLGAVRAALHSPLVQASSLDPSALVPAGRDMSPCRVTGLAPEGQGT